MHCLLFYDLVPDYLERRICRDAGASDRVTAPPTASPRCLPRPGDCGPLRAGSRQGFGLHRSSILIPRFSRCVLRRPR